MNYQPASFIDDGVTSKFWLAEDANYAIKLRKDGFILVSQFLKNSDGTVSSEQSEVWLGPEEIEIIKGILEEADLAA